MSSLTDLRPLHTPRRFSSEGALLGTADGRWELQETVGAAKPWQVYGVRRPTFGGQVTRYPVGQPQLTLALAKRELARLAARNSAEQWGHRPSFLPDEATMAITRKVA